MSHDPPVAHFSHTTVEPSGETLGFLFAAVSEVSGVIDPFASATS